MAILIDSYSESNVSGPGYQLWQAKSAQSFTANGLNLDSCKWYLKKLGSPTGNIYAYLYAHSGTYGTSSVPTGSPLATSEPIDVSTLTTSFQLITFTFSGANQIALTNGGYYELSIEQPGGDGSNTVAVGYDSTLPTHSGNSANDEGTGWVVREYDGIFYVYGNENNQTSAFFQFM